MHTEFIRCLKRVPIWKTCENEGKAVKRIGVVSQFSCWMLSIDAAVRVYVRFINFITGMYSNYGSSHSAFGLFHHKCLALIFHFQNTLMGNLDKWNILKLPTNLFALIFEIKSGENDWVLNLFFVIIIFRSQSLSQFFAGLDIKSR